MEEETQDGFAIRRLTVDGSEIAWHPSWAPFMAAPFMAAPFMADASKGPPLHGGCRGGWPLDEGTSDDAGRASKAEGAGEPREPHIDGEAGGHHAGQAAVAGVEGARLDGTSLSPRPTTDMASSVPAEKEIAWQGLLRCHHERIYGNRAAGG
jgi:hypothetical protein